MTDTTEHVTHDEPAPATTPYSGRHSRPDAAAAPRHVHEHEHDHAPGPRHLADCDVPSVRSVSARLEIARRLGTLGSQWRVLHDVPFGEDTVDHLAIGPGGVFTISTRYHPGAKVVVRGDKLDVDGFDAPYVADSRSQAQRVAAVLSEQAQFDVEVLGLIAVIGAPGGFTVKAQTYDGAVNVLTRKEIVPHLWAQPEVLGEPSVERIHDVASRRVTHHPQPAVEWSDVTTTPTAGAIPMAQMDSPGPTATG